MSKYLLIFILIFGFLIRIWNISQFPVSLNWDEASHGYNAYSIAQTGKDEWGNSYPLIFRAFGDYKLPVYIYSLVPMVSLFGLNAFSIRSVSVIAGTLSIFATFLLSHLLFPKNKSVKSISLMASFFVAISPWNIFVSRIAVEANLASCLVIWGAVAFLHGVGQVKLRAKPFSLLFSSILFGLSMFTYNSARIFTPLIFITLVIAFWKYWGFSISFPIKIPYFSKLFSKINNQVIKPACFCHLSAFALMLLFVFVMLYQTLFTQGANARFSNISLLDQGAINYINQSRGNSNFSPSISRIIHNKFTYILTKSTLNYIGYFNPVFWFYSGGTHYQFNIPGFALLPWITLPLILFGLFKLKKLNRISIFIILAWIIIAPIPASVTRDNPHALRILLLNPIPQLLAAIGFSALITKTRNFSLKVIMYVFIFFIIGLQTVLFWHIYTTNYARDYDWAWQSGSAELVSTIKQKYDSYDHIFVTKKYGEPHIFFALYWPWNVSDYQSNKTWEYRDAATSYAWYWVNKLGKITFVNDWEMKNVSCPENKKCLRVDSSEIVVNKWSKIGEINSYSHNRIYSMYESEI